MEISKKLWDGTIPLCIIFSHEGVDRELYLEIHRVSYFPLIYEKLVSYFSHYDTGLNIDKIWLEFDDGQSKVPIQWNIPSGLLYDLLHTTSGNNSIWTLRLVHNNYPSKHILPHANVTHLKTTYMNQIKQSSYVLYGNSKAIMSLSAGKSEELWNSVVKHNWTLYEAISTNDITKNKNILRVPVKLFISGSPVVIQAPIFPSAKNGVSHTTLKDVLYEHVPTLFHGGITAKVIVHGVDISFLLDSKDSPSILELWKLFKNVDNFLNLIIRAPADSVTDNYLANIATTRIVA
ncbi:autophagy protein 5 [[Candida] railenensis]|uniref:Autophagy protein 5 n=1 Tax=[Candida] railenensis TaxID=45579 RepID=A0A9P0QLH0_9ASCO|nr:autophagy protein 5 [[Candida] railenensis]